MNVQRSGRTRGMTIIEAAAVTAVLAAGAALVAPLGATLRADAQRELCKSNLKWFGAVAAAYAADHQGVMATFSWRAGETRVFSDGVERTIPDRATYQSAATFQMMSIIGLRSGLVGLPYDVRNLFPHPYYSHLVLQDYADIALPDFRAACPADDVRLAWKADPAGAIAGEVLPYPASSRTPGGHVRWPFSSSYEIVVAAWDPAQSEDIRTYNGRTANVAWRSMSSPPSAGDVPLDRVAFPGAKVHVFETFDMHQPSRPGWGLDHARGTLLSYDGAVRVRATADANLGWIPSQPHRSDPTRFTYWGTFFDPPTNDWLPPTQIPGQADLFTGAYAWTRGGNLGIDFGGKEINTGQPD